MAKPQRITSRNNPQIVQLRKLAHDSLAYRQQGRLWLEGEHLCETYAARGHAPALAVITEPAWEQPRWRAMAQAAAAVIVVSRALMGTLSTLESPPPLAFAVDWRRSAELLGSAPTVVLDRVQDAGNVGAILRCAAAFDFTQVLAVKGSAGLGSPKVLRSAMGAHFRLHLVEAIDESALEGLQLTCLAADAHATQDLQNATLPWPCAWIFGHEGQGISATLRQRCAMSLRIPQPGGQESLNVASAAAVCLYESMRQRRHPVPARGE